MLKFFSNKRQSPDAQAVLASILQKRSAAVDVHAQAVADVERLSHQSELPDGTGLIVGAQQIAEARNVRDVAAQEIERLTAAAAEAERRAEAARVADEAGELDRAWSGSATLATKGEAELSAALAAFAKAFEAADAFLQTRKQLIERCPARGEILGLGTKPATDATGYDRVLRLVQLVVEVFHPDRARSRSSDHDREVARIMDDERRLLALLGKRPSSSPAV